MRIQPEAREKLLEFLQDYDDSFVRIAQLSVGGG